LRPCEYCTNVMLQERFQGRLLASVTGAADASAELLLQAIHTSSTLHTTLHYAALQTQ